MEKSWNCVFEFYGNPQYTSLLVLSKCLDDQICLAPYPWISPGLEQMHHLNRVLELKKNTSFTCMY